MYRMFHKKTRSAPAYCSLVYIEDAKLLIANDPTKRQRHFYQNRRSWKHRKTARTSRRTSGHCRNISFHLFNLKRRGERYIRGVRARENNNISQCTYKNTSVNIITISEIKSGHRYTFLNMNGAWSRHSKLDAKWRESLSVFTTDTTTNLVRN